MTRNTVEVIAAKRRTVLKALGIGAAGTVFVSSNAASRSSPVGDIVFEDDFEDGQLAWTDIDHPEFWTEDGGQVHYSPSTSAGSTGDNYLYANETFDGNQGLLEWPVGIEFKAYASDTSAGIGAFAAKGGPKDGVSTRLGVRDSAYQDNIFFWNSEETFELTGARDNDTWYTYRLIPDLKNNEIHISRNDQSWTIPEPNDDPIGNTSIVLSGGTCWGCGGNGDRKYEYITVWDIPTQIEVDIDIKPGSDPNAINPNNRGVIPVAILTTDEFDAPSQVDMNTLQFGPPDVVQSGGGARPAHNGHIEDVSGDGNDDLVVHFPTHNTGFQNGDAEGTLVGATTGGTPLTGSDSVKIVGS